MREKYRKTRCEERKVEEVRSAKKRGGEENEQGARREDEKETDGKKGSR